VAKFVLTHLDASQRGLLFTNDAENAKMQILLDCLNHNLCRASVTPPSGLAVNQQRLEARLSRVCDAVCAAYADDDPILIDFYTDFTKRVAGLALVPSQIHVSLMQQVVLSTDCCGEGDQQAANESVFKFFRALLTLSEDPLAVGDLVARAALPNLEGQHWRVTAHASLLVADVAKAAATADSGSAVMRSLRLQMEPVLEAMCGKLLDCGQQTLPSTISFQAELIQSLASVCGVAEWASMTADKLTVSKLESLIKECTSLGLKPFLLLILGALASVSDSHAALVRSIMSDKEAKTGMVTRLKNKACSRREEKAILAILDNTFKLPHGPQGEDEDVVVEQCQEVVHGVAASEMPPAEVEAVVEKISKEMSANNVRLTCLLSFP